MKIDVHAHFVPPQWNDWRAHGLADDWPYLEAVDPCFAILVDGERRSLRLREAAWSPERRLEDMDRLGIDLQVLSPLPSLFGYDRDVIVARDFARRQNEWVADVAARYPARFAGMATVPLQEPEVAIEELHDAHGRLGLRAVEIGTTIAGRELDDEALEPFFAACGALDIAVFVHPGNVKAGGSRLQRYYLPNIVGNPLESALAASRFILGGVLERWPNLRVCFSHAGGALPAIVGRLNHGWSTRDETRERSQTPPLETARRLYYDSITHDPQLLRYLVEELRFERIVMGSDYPFEALGEPDPIAFLQRSGLPTAIQAKIAGANGLGFLGR